MPFAYRVGRIDSLNDFRSSADSFGGRVPYYIRPLDSFRRRLAFQLHAARGNRALQRRIFS